MLRKCLSLKKRLRAGEVTLGAWLSFHDPAVAEIMAASGFDWLLIDGEHAPFTTERLATILMAFNGRSTVPIIRVPWNDRILIKQALDLGAGGVLVPYVCSVEEARRAVAACKYPPEGIRGVGPRRASGYGQEMDEYLRLANEAIIVAVQIEHIDGVNAIGEILAVPGIDVVVLGPMDLSASLGLMGELEHPSVVEAIERVVAEARKLGLPVGVPMPADATVDDVLYWNAKGSRFVIGGVDQGFLQQAASASLARLREHLAVTVEE